MFKGLKDLLGISNSDVIDKPKSTSNPTPVKSISKQDIVNQTIMEIHNSFEIASDLAVAEAQNIINRKPIENEEALRTLNSLGFTQAKGVVELNEKDRALALVKEEIDLISRWSHKYPQYKFILERQVKDICSKYNLVCGDVSMYKGDVPLKNINEIANFKINEDDESYIDIEFGMWGNRNNRIYDYAYVKNINQMMFSRTDYDKCSFMICAQVSDMVITNRHQLVDGYKIQEIPDPIVLYPVNGGYLVVSKWGLEGNDSSLVNEKMN